MSILVRFERRSDPNKLLSQGVVKRVVSRYVGRWFDVEVPSFWVFLLVDDGWKVIVQKISSSSSKGVVVM